MRLTSLVSSTDNGLSSAKSPAQFEASGFFALRTPLLPFDEFLHWSSGLETAKVPAEPPNLERAIASDRARLRARLLEIYRRPEMREALFVASPNLDDAFPIWEQDPENQRSHGLELALVRYFSRTAARATPFGLCAGCSVGKIGAQTRLILSERASYQRHTRLDMDYLHGLCEELLRDPQARSSFAYRPNSSLYRAAGRLHYHESRLKDKERSYHLVAVAETDYLTQTLARAECGARFADLAAALVDDEVSRNDAEEYFHQLIESQILIPDMSLRLTGAEPMAPLIERLRQLPATEQLAKTLQDVSVELAALDENGLGNAPELYREMARRLETLPAKVDLPRLYQVDMVKPAAEATLGEAVLREIGRGVEILHCLAVPQDRSNEELKRFREVFVARYEAREVPLTEALDSEAGIGFPVANDAGADASPLLRDLNFPDTTDETARWGKREKFLLQKLSAALAQGADEIVLDARDLEKLAAKNPLPLPDAFSVMTTLAAASDEALARGDFRVRLHNVTGPSGARFLGRFCHADEALRLEVERHLKAEESLRPDAIFAEVVHLPQGRSGNVLARPVLRAHEIFYLGGGGAAGESQIPITDLRVSVREERIILRSARLGREVIPRLTSAHNFVGGSVGLYRFLGLLQGQGLADQFGWSWGVLESAPFLPRVTTGRLMLARARWRLDKEEIKMFANLRGSACYRAVDAWRKARRLPRIVLFADGDNEFPVDFENVLSVETFVHLLKGREDAILVQLFPPPEQLCARGPEGRFVHELIVPFVRKAEQSEQHRTRVPITDHRSPITAPRTFPPGSEWLYAQLYSGTSVADHVLREVIRPVTAEALRSGAADQWFFLRYGDPDWHIRLRLRGRPARLLAEVIPAIHAAAAPLLRDGRIWRVQLDTYEREVERYGGIEGVMLAERLFHIDSEATLEIIERLDASDAGLDERWRLTLRGIDLLLHDFQFNAETKLAVMRNVRTTFAREFRADTNLKKQIGERFRKERKDLEALLDPRADTASPLALGLEILHGRSASLAPIVAELGACASAGRLSMPLEKLAPSYIHMHANRMLRSAHRAHELVLYEFLVRLYTRRVVPAKP